MANYVLFDTETTGSKEDDRIIQIGALVVHSKNDIHSYNELCSSSKEISLEAMEIHNITPEIIADKPPFSETAAIAQINSLNNSDNFLIAHNISFDLSMLEKEGFVNNYQLVDTLRCSRHLLADSKYHRLQYLRYSLELYKDEPKEAELIGIDIKAHDALSDVIVMKLLLSRLVKLAKEQYPSEYPMHKLVELTKTPVLLGEFKFGKYKNQKIKDIVNQDAGYIKWMLGNLELDEDLEYTLKFYLDKF